MNDATKNTKEIANALTDLAQSFPVRFRVRGSGQGDNPFSANVADEGFDGVTCPAQTGKVKNCGECGLCFTTLANINFAGHANALKDDHYSILNSTTVFHNKNLVEVEDLTDKITALKKSKNEKIGPKVIKGHPHWRGASFLTLTLTERATCPRQCKHWNDCYGNNLHQANRLQTEGLMEAIEAELAVLGKFKNRKYAIRLHVIGDFYSVEYVEFWKRMLETYDNILVFGYTAHAIDNSHLARKVVDTRSTFRKMLDKVFNFFADDAVKV
jgi:hypothetical protein